MFPIWPLFSALVPFFYHIIICILSIRIQKTTSADSLFLTYMKVLRWWTHARASLNMIDTCSLLLQELISSPPPSQDTGELWMCSHTSWTASLRQHRNKRMNEVSLTSGDHVATLRDFRIFSRFLFIPQWWVLSQHPLPAGIQACVWIRVCTGRFILFQYR